MSSSEWKAYLIIQIFITKYTQAEKTWRMLIMRPLLETPQTAAAPVMRKCSRPTSRWPPSIISLIPSLPSLHVRMLTQGTGRSTASSLCWWAASPSVRPWGCSDRRSGRRGKRTQSPAQVMSSYGATNRVSKWVGLMELLLSFFYFCKWVTSYLSPLDLRRWQQRTLLALPPPAEPRHPPPARHRGPGGGGDSRHREEQHRRPAIWVMIIFSWPIVEKNWR